MGRSQLVEEAQRIKRELGDTLLECATEGILAADRDGQIRVANPALEQLFGYAKDELLGESIEILLPRSLAEIHVKHREAYFSEPRTRPMGLGLDLAGRRKDGSEFPVKISLSHVDASGVPLVLAFVTDITERKRLDAEREQLQRQLQQAVKMEAVGRLAGGVAHDFNNFLTAMSGFSEIVLDYLDEDHPLRDGAEETFRTCQRSAALVRQLLAVSRRQLAQPVAFDLNVLITELEKMLRALIGEDIDLQVELAGDPGLVRAEVSQMEQVLLNLVVNARDAMPKGGILRLRLDNVDFDTEEVRKHPGGREGPHVMLEVSDTGHGMDEETLSHIFEPFFSTKKEKGTGLGLATVYGIVKQSDGDIWVHSELRKGTSFKVCLPRVDGLTQETQAPRQHRPLRTGRETILVVEDEKVVRFIVRHTLTKAGYTILEARDAEHALLIAHEHRGEIGLLLTDVVMPRMNGPQLAARVAVHRPGIRTLYMSGYADDAIAQHGIMDEHSPYIEKPFTCRALSAKVRDVLES